MYIQQLQYFVLVAEKLNFSEAAKALYVSQSSLSYGVASLENELGFKLFNRTRQNVSLTDAGKMLYPEIKNLLIKLDNALDNARKVNAGTQGQLRVGFLRSILREHFAEWIPIFQVRYPEVQVSVLELNPQQLNEGLLQGSIDIAFTRSFNLLGEDKLKSAPLYDSQSEIIISRKNRLSSMDELDFSALADVSLITMSGDTAPGWDTVVDSIFSAYGITPRVTYAAQSLDVILSMVVCNAGIGIFNSPAHMLCDPNLIRTYPVPGNLARHQVVAAWNPENKNPTITMMLDVLKPFHHY